MEKESLDAADMLSIAAEHAYCAEHLLGNQAEITTEFQITVDTFLPISTLMYQAFELTLKAYLHHDHRPIKERKTLSELIDLNRNLGLSNQEIKLLHTLARQQAFRKGTFYDLWKDRQQQQVFCEQILSLFAKIQELMPLELQKDYLV